MDKGVLSDDKYAYLQLIHPKVGNCHKLLIPWRECYQNISQWIPEWADNICTIKIELQDCISFEIPVKIEKSNSECSTWWIPLPHVGGKPVTYYRTTLEINKNDCKQQ